MPVKKLDQNKLALALHKKLKGKISISVKSPLKTKKDWAAMCSSGVEAVSAHLAKKPAEGRNYTIKSNSVAVISDGSAVLSLGNLGALPVLPVIENKAVVLKTLADIDAIPLVLDTQEPEEIIRTIKVLAPNFGGINLSGIAAPKCFEIEKRLKHDLAIPVLHDDQQSIAIVVLASLINAVKVVEKKFSALRVVIVGAGVAGRAIALLLIKAGVGEVTVVDSRGIIYKGRPGLAGYKNSLAEVTNPNLLSGDVMTAVDGVDVLIGASGPGTVAQAHVEKMSRHAIVFTLSNPVPEIMPKDAKRAGAAVVATGRFDLPNHLTDALVTAGIFRGALDHEVQDITDEIKITIAKKIASLIKKPTAENIIPSIMTVGLTKVVAGVVKAVKKVG